MALGLMTNTVIQTSKKPVFAHTHKPIYKIHGHWVPTKIVNGDDLAKSNPFISIQMELINKI